MLHVPLHIARTLLLLLLLVTVDVAWQFTRVNWRQHSFVEQHRCVDGLGVIAACHSVHAWGSRRVDKRLGVDRV